MGDPLSFLVYLVYHNPHWDFEGLGITDYRVYGEIGRGYGYTEKIKVRYGSRVVEELPLCRVTHNKDVKSFEISDIVMDIHINKELTLYVTDKFKSTYFVKNKIINSYLHIHEVKSPIHFNRSGSIPGI